MSLARVVRKELAVIILTVCGVLSTIAISYLLRHLDGLRDLAMADQADFIGFVIYGLAISLIASASREMRARDTAIMILGATIIWGVFIESGDRAGMIRFLLFAAATVYMTRLADRVWGKAAGWRLLGGAAGPAFACLLLGLGYSAIATKAAGTGAPAGLMTGATWGFSLGLAVGLGLSIGGELLKWMSKDGS